MKPLLLFIFILPSLAAAPTTQRTRSLPAILSPDPKTFAPASDPALNQLIAGHNTLQSRLNKLKLKADCVWTLDMRGEPRPMTIVYDRPAAHASLACGAETGEVAGPTITFGLKSAINIDALYLLAFRTFNPKDFKPAPAPPKLKKPLIFAKSDTETLAFDPETRRLERLEIQTDKGLVIALFTNYKPLPNNPKAILPTKIEITVPPDMYPFSRNVEGTIELTINPRESVAE